MVIHRVVTDCRDQWAMHWHVSEGHGGSNLGAEHELYQPRNLHTRLPTSLHHFAVTVFRRFFTFVRCLKLIAHRFTCERCNLLSIDIRRTRVAPKLFLKIEQKMRKWFVICIRAVIIRSNSFAHAYFQWSLNICSGLSPHLATCCARVKMLLNELDYYHTFALWHRTTD